LNVENICQFYKRLGFHIIESPSSYWLNLGPRFYVALPPQTIIVNPDEDEMAKLCSQPGVLGLKYSTERSTRSPTAAEGDGQPGAIYLLSDKSYDLAKLSRSTRRHTRRGLKMCSVEQIGFDELKAKGMQANLDTLCRQKRDDPIFSQSRRWASFCHAGGAVEGAGVWGAFVNDELAAYAVTFITDDCCNILYQMSCTDMMQYRVNLALFYTINRKMLALPGINRICCGMTPIIDLPGLDTFKTRLGYEKRPVHFKVKLRPWLGRLLLNSAGRGALSLARRVAPDVYLLKQANGFLSIGRASR